jgi:hypothetical protein
LWEGYYCSPNGEEECLLPKGQNVLHEVYMSET